eukprot:TRINITY_DN18189_c0_g1_i1.p1 TRINITY_DN18189_c0_g1~~TRINITY_DN18189_c0_g1_i1.p1  ORF type:complete len:338 (+),score=51.60 TRINITY_DN18189_c0_g1_i1:97-1110(+)
MHRLIPLLLSLLSASVLSGNVQGDVPLAVWSGEGFFDGQMFGIGYTISNKDVEHFLSTLIKSTPSEEDKYITEITTATTGRPEVLVVFLEDKLRSSYLSTYKKSFSNLRNLLQSSSRSLYAPFVNLEQDTMLNSINNLVKSTNHNEGKCYYVESKNTESNLFAPPTESVITVDLQDLSSTLVSSSAFTNGHTDLIIISLNHKTNDLETRFKDSDSIISTVNNMISEHTTKYVCAYCANTYDTPRWYSKLTEKKRSLLQAPEPSPSSDVPSDVPHPFGPEPAPSNYTPPATPNTFKLYFGGWFWELFLVVIVLIPLLIMGIFSINGIQTPLFEEKKKK